MFAWRVTWEAHEAASKLQERLHAKKGLQSQDFGGNSSAEASR